jgi:cobalt-zinc-cadmium efflux system protein
MQNRFVICLSILLVTFLIELFGGLACGSLSLVSDSFHVLSDLFALSLSYFSALIARKKMPTDKMTYGYHRLEVFSALVNGVTMIGISFFIIFEAIERINMPRTVMTLPALWIAIFGLGVNVLCAFILRRTGEHRDLNMKSAYLHLIGDALASCSVVAGILIMRWTQFYMIDGLVAIFISILIFLGAVRVLASGAGILLQQSPHELDHIRDQVRKISGVIDLEDLRLWQVCSNLIVGTAHVITNVTTLMETEEIAMKIKVLLQSQFNICHMTLQFESPAMAERHTHEFEHLH